MDTHDSSYWQGFYLEKPRPGWDLDGPTPLLPELLDLTGGLGLPLGSTVAVPGCGFGHDAAELARRGFKATGVDFAPAAVLGARERYGDLAAWRQEDWFTTAGQYHALFDHTCFVAMAPAQRPAYIDACARHLRPGGLWLGAFFHTVAVPPGPPYAIAMEDLRTLVAPRFQVLHLDQAIRSHPRRAGREFLLVARRREDPAG